MNDLPLVKNIKYLLLKGCFTTNDSHFILDNLWDKLDFLYFIKIFCSIQVKLNDVRQVSNATAMT